MLCRVEQGEGLLVSIRSSILRLALVLLRCEVVFLFTAASR